LSWRVAWWTLTWGWKVSWRISRRSSIGRVIRVPSRLLVGRPVWRRLHVWRKVGVVRVLIWRVHVMGRVWARVVWRGIWGRVCLCRKCRKIHVLTRIIFVVIIIHWFFFSLFFSFILFLLLHSCNKWSRSAVCWRPERSI